MTNRDTSGPGVRFPPPLLFAGGLGLGALLHHLWPLPLWRGDRPGVILVLAYGLIAAGLGWMLWGLITFRRARTAIIPNRPASQLVTHGPYRFGRNPMYLGMSALYWGVALWLNSLWAVVLFPLVILLLMRFVIRREERYLARAFGPDYLQYCQRVPRWLTFRPQDPSTLT